MESKTNKRKLKSNDIKKSIRLESETFKKAECILQMANKKDVGRTIKLDPLLRLALDLVTDEHIRLLQSQSLKNSDRQEILRQKYGEIYGPTSMEEYVAFTLTLAYADFLKEHGHLVAAT